MVGLGFGVSQMLSRSVASGDDGRSWGIIAWSGLIVTVSSTVCAAVLILEAGDIARFVDKPAVEPVLRFLAWLVPAGAVIQLGVAVFRGLQQSLPKLLFSDLLPRALKFGGVVAVVVVGGGFMGVLWASVFGPYVAAVLLLAYAIRKLPKMLVPSRPQRIAWKLVRFSAPLFGVSLIVVLETQLGTLLVGYFLPSEAVAIYSAPQRLRLFVELPLTAMVFIYLPMVTRISKVGTVEDVGAFYRTTTKWISLSSLAIVLVLLLDARFLITALFGDQYLGSVSILRVLVLGSFVHSFLGPNGMTLLGFGERSPLLLSAAVGAVANLGLGVALIPNKGAIGAAVAMSVALAASNTVVSIRLYRRFGIHPFGGRYLWLMATPCVAAVVFYVSLGISRSQNVVLHLGGFLLIVFLCVLTPFLLRCVDVTDLALLEAIEMKLFGRATFFRKIALLCHCPVDGVAGS